MINGYQSKLLDIYSKIREEEANLLKERKAEIKKYHPEILEIDDNIKKLSLQLSLDILKGKSEDTIKDYKEKITDLRIEKCESLVANGYDQDYLNLHYKCDKCKDTGFIGNTKCSCYYQNLIKLYYEKSSLQNVLNEKNFNYFDINLFSNNKTGNEKYSPRENMEKHLEYITSIYLPNFKDSDTNLLFYGNPGSGKTYLSYCIAKELLDAGCLVVYKTSDELINNLKEIRFNNNSELEDILVNCDLLIIDDLGAEQKNEFCITELFNLLNKKLLLHKKMLISTNLSIADISNIYSERIYSRLIGEFKLCKFYCKDIRITLNLKRG